MSAVEYLAFVPLLIYGMGITELLREWKRLTRPKEAYLPYVLLTVILTEIAVYNVFFYAKIIQDLPGQSYFHYLYHLIPPFLFQLLINVFTPDEGVPTEAYLKKYLRLISILLILFILSYRLYDLEPNLSFNIRPFISIGILLAMIITNNIKLVYVFALAWLITLYFRGFENSINF